MPRSPSAGSPCLGIGATIVAVGLGMGLFPVVATALARRDKDGRIGGRNSDTGGTRVGNDGPPDATG